MTTMVNTNQTRFENRLQEAFNHAAHEGREHLTTKELASVVYVDTNKAGWWTHVKTRATRLNLPVEKILHDTWVMV